jgi:hypothetical protein
VMVVIVREEVHSVIVVMVPLTKGSESSFFFVQDHLFILQMPVSVNICKHSRVIDRDERHLYEVRDWVVVTELCEVLSIID